MRTEMSEVTIKINFPYDKPDKNGYIYTKDAIENALKEGVSNLPIMYLDNNGFEKIVGCVNDEQVVPEWDSENGVCKIIINGKLFFAGTSCVVNKKEDNIIKDFKIQSIGISN